MKILQMTLTDICYDTNVRSCNLTQTMHLTEFTDSHLQHRRSMLLCDPKYGQRKSDFVIIVSRCF